MIGCYIKASIKGFNRALIYSLYRTPMSILNIALAIILTVAHITYQPHAASAQVFRSQPLRSASCARRRCTTLHHPTSDCWRNAHEFNRAPKSVMLLSFTLGIWRNMVQKNTRPPTTLHCTALCQLTWKPRLHALLQPRASARPPASAREELVKSYSVGFCRAPHSGFRSLHGCVQLLEIMLTKDLGTGD